MFKEQYIRDNEKLHAKETLLMEIKNKDAQRKGAEQKNHLTPKQAWIRYGAIAAAFVLVAGGMVVGATALILAGLTGLTRWTWSNAPVELGGAVVAPWVPLAGLVLVTAVLAYATGLMGARALGPRVASFVSLTEVLAATIFAWLLLGELPRVVQLVGGVAIVLGACAVKIGEVRELRSAASAASGTSAGAAGAGGSAADSGR